MARIIRRLLICLIIAAGIFVAFQWKNYQKKVECRENALLYFQEQDYQKAIVYLEEGLDGISLINKDINKDMSCYLAESYYQLGESEKAVRLYDELIEKYPKEKMYYLMKGDSIIASGNVEEAVKVFEKGWKKTANIVFLEKICDSYIDAKDYQHALEYAQKGAQERPEDAADFIFKKIIIFENANDYASALETAKEYVNLYPEDEKGQKELIFLTTRN